MDNVCNKTGGVLVGIKEELGAQSAKDEALAAQIEALRAMGMGGIYKGVYVFGTSYVENDIVSRDGILYSSNVDSNTTVPPSESWTLLIQPDAGYYTGEAS